MNETLTRTLTNLLMEIERADERDLHRRPYQLLASAQDTGKVLSLEAAKVWQEIIDAYPADPFGLHHLAIIQHGHGIQRYLTDAKANDSLESCRLGLQNWARLLEQDSFWEALREGWKSRVSREKGGTAEGAGDFVAEKLLKLDLRAKRGLLPDWVLGQHEAIVLANHHADPDLARAHLHLILSSEFSPEAVKRSRRRVFDSIAGKLDATMAVGEAELERIEAYLAIDPEYTFAVQVVIKILADGARQKRDQQEAPQPRERWLERGKPWENHAGLRQLAGAEVDQTGAFDAAEALRLYYFEWAALRNSQGIIADNTRVQGVAIDRFREAMVFAKTSVEFERAGRLSRANFMVFCTNLCSTALDYQKDDVARIRGWLQEGLSIDPEHAYGLALYARCCYRLKANAEFLEALGKAEVNNETQQNNFATSLIDTLKGLSWEPDRVTELLRELDNAAADHQMERLTQLVKTARKLVERSSHPELRRVLEQYKGL